MDQKSQAQPQVQSAVVKNVSKGPATISAPGYVRIQIDAGQTHVFENMKAYAIYQKSCQALKDMGILEIAIGDKVEKQDKTPLVDAQKKAQEDAAKASQMTPPANTNEDEGEEEEGEEEEESKDEKADTKKNKGIASSKKK